MTEPDWQLSVLRDLGAGQDEPTNGAPLDAGRLDHLPPPPYQPPPAYEPQPYQPYQPAPEPVRPPEPVGPTPEALLRARRHGDPLARRLGQRARGLGGSAAQEARRTVGISQQLAQPVTTGRRIAVASVRGGAGKSTVAALLGSALAAHRIDRILAVDADPYLGSLGPRLGAASPLPVRVFGSASGLSHTGPDHRPVFEAGPPTFRDFGEAEPYLAHVAGRLWALTGDAGSAAETGLELDAFRAATAALARFFAVTVTDAGAGLLTELNRGIVADAHALVLVAPATVDGVMSAGRALAWLATGPLAGLAGRTVVVLNAISPEASAIDAGRASAALAATGPVVVRLPFDRHLASGSLLDPYLLGAGTRSALLEIAADALTRATWAGS
jgi:MinD-like ATPase involved in chromosome partitioning or flagellar assembly